MASTIQVAGLEKSYGALKAVDGINFSVEAGETFGLLGPNGAGKSTTIHMLVGVLRPDAGSIEIECQSDPTRQEVRRKIGVAPQASALYGQLNAAENLRFFGRLYGLSGKHLAQRVAWALEFAQLTSRQRDRVGGFSGGMKRRLNLACALVHDPPVLLLDEPTAGVDPQSRNHLLDNIASLAAAGRTIVYTTHYMEEAQKLCRRVAIMDHGKILAVDTVDNLIAAHGGRTLLEGELASEPPSHAKLPGERQGDVLRMFTDQPFEQAARLAADGVKFQRLKIERPDLESVFLTLTGRRLRD